MTQSDEKKMNEHFSVYLLNKIASTEIKLTGAAYDTITNPVNNSSAIFVYTQHVQSIY